MVAGNSNAEEIKKKRRRSRKLSPEAKTTQKSKAKVDKAVPVPPVLPVVQTAASPTSVKKEPPDRTVAIPELQREDFVAPRPARPEVPDFGKTAVIPDLSEEPISKEGLGRPGASKPAPPQEKKEVTMVLSKSEFQRARRLEQFKQQKSSHVVWWILAALLIILVLIFLVIRNY